MVYSPRCVLLSFAGTWVTWSASCRGFCVTGSGFRRKVMSEISCWTNPALPVQIHVQSPQAPASILLKKLELDCLQCCLNSKLRKSLQVSVLVRDPNATWVVTHSDLGSLLSLLSHTTLRPRIHTHRGRQGPNGSEATLNDRSQVTAVWGH